MPIENLIDQSQRTPEERKAVSRAGGIASGKAKRRKKKILELANEILYMPLNEIEKDACEQLGINPNKVKNKGTLGFLACFQRAMKDGNTQSLERLFAMAGEIIEKDIDVNDNQNQALIYLPEEEESDGTEDI